MDQVAAAIHLRPRRFPTVIERCITHTSPQLPLVSGLEGLILLRIRPDLGLTWPIPRDLIFLRSFSFTPGMLLMLAVQTWVAVRWRSFDSRDGAGYRWHNHRLDLFAIPSTVLSISPHSAQVYLARFFPWSLPYAIVWNDRAALLFGQATNLLQPALVEGIAGGLLVAALGCWNVVRRDVS